MADQLNDAKQREAETKRATDDQVQAQSEKITTLSSLLMAARNQQEDSQAHLHDQVANRDREIR